MDHGRKQVEPRPETAREGCLFADRKEAGAQLAAKLAHLRGRNALVIGIARGGMPVAREVARRLDADLDVIVVRKLGAPGQPELAIGALTADGTYRINRELVLQLGVSDASIAHVADLQSREAQRLELLLREGRPAKSVAGRTVVLVDDGLATGATMRTAVHAIAPHKLKGLIVAAPVGAPEACHELEWLVDELVCPNRPESFRAVGDYYRAFDATTDAEVVDILHARPERRAS